VAAATVAVIAGVAAWSVGVGEGGGADGTPAGGGATSASAGPTASTDPAETPSAPVASPGDGQGHRAGSGDCPQEMENVLPGADRVADFGDGTSFWVEGDRFVLCDVRGTTTVHHPLSMDPVPAVETYRVSSVYTPAGKGGFEVTRVAGGVVPDGAPAYDVAYTFPDGETVPAETAVGEDGRTWWRVVHSYPSTGNEMKDPPITVQVSYSGVQKTYRLAWATDTCAQANHGC